MTKIPTDLEILDLIFESYYKPFAEVPRNERSAFISIDIKELSRKLGVDPDIVFGRLYHWLEKKHGVGDSHFFSISVGSKKNAVNFPMLSSILADLRRGRRTETTALVLSIISIVISLLSFVTALVLSKST